LSCYRFPAPFSRYGNPGATTKSTWRQSAAVRPALGVLLAFALLRTAFLTTLETPEPRYVLVCFPVIIALAAQVFSRPADPVSGSGLSPRMAPDAW
jgi:hypothetical protein